MLKIRVTFMKKEDLRIALQKLKKEFNVLSISKIYRNKYKMDLDIRIYKR